MDEQLYEIQDGVRRAKAAWLCGYETIPAQRGETPSPILVEPGARGPSIKQVEVEENELDAFRRNFNAGEG